MVSIRVIRDDIKMSGGQMFDDQKVSDAQIEYWIIAHADLLSKKHIENQGVHEQKRSGLFLKTFVRDIALDDDGDFTDGNPLCRKYITLPRSIYDIEMDGGVDYMCYYVSGECDGCPPRFIKTTFSRTTPMLLSIRGKTQYEKPSPKNPYWYREEDRLWLIGIESVPLSILSKVEVGLLTTLPDVINIDIDEPLRFPAELLPVLKRYVIDMLRINMGLPGTKLRNDGTEVPPAAQQRTAPLVSVNDENLNV